MLLAFILRNLGRVEEARSVLEPARRADNEPDQIVRAEALGELAALAIFGGEVAEAGPLLEDAC